MRWGGVGDIGRVVREDFLEEATFDLRPVG